MTEPAPGGGSDPSMIRTRAEKKGDRYVVTGRKWFATGAWVKCADPWSGPPGQMHHGHPHFDERVMREVLKVVARPASEDPPPPPDAVAERAAVPPYPAFPRVSPLRAFSRPFFPAD